MADAGGQAGGAFLGGEQIGLQGGAADGMPGAGRAGWLGFGSVELFEQVAVPVKEGAVDAGAASDAADADFLSACCGVVEGLEDALAAAGRVGPPPFGHRIGGAVAHAVRSGRISIAAGRMRGMPSMVAR